MIGSYKTALNALFDRTKKIDNQTSPQNVLTKENNSTFRDNEEKDRCERILNYWLDTELFDLPECPLNYKKDLISKPAKKFKENWIDEAEEEFKAGKLIITDKSRLLVMFQCHRAGYIAKDDETHKREWPGH